MAFVFRAKRDIKLSNLEENNHFSGEYYQEPQLVKNIEKQSSEFQSKSQRNLNINKFNTPGPGSYEKNNQDQDLFGGFNQYRKPKNIIETIKMSVIPTDIQKFIQKYQSIAFNSRGKRFNYKNEELEKEKPGPGAYEPDINYSSSPKNNNKENSLNKNNNNINNINDSRSVISNDNNISLNLNIMPKNNSRNNSSFISSNNNKSTESTSLNNNSTNINNKLVKINKSFNSQYRIETIPSKNNLGYDIDKNGDKKMITQEKDINQMDGTINDSAGPGQYNIPISWDKNIIDWKKTRNDNDEKYDIIKSRKNLSPLSQLEKDCLMNTQKGKKLNSENNNGIYQYKIKTKTEINNSSPLSKTNPRSKIFNYFMNNRYDKQKSICERKKEELDPIFSTSPGPGYYYPDTQYETNKKNLSLSPNYNHGFNSNIPRFKTFNKVNNDLGPGFYYNKSKPKIVEKPKYILGITPNKEDNLCALKLSLAKENYKVPGPGSYHVEGNLLKEDITKNQNFGSNDIRFKKNNTNKENSPGPGYYNIKTLFQMDKKETNDKKNNVYKNYKSDLELIKELEKIPKEIYNPPPVGFYNPNIVSSLEYEIKSKVNPYLDEKNVGFGIQEKKGMAFINQDNNVNVGPGKYFRTKKTENKQNMAAFNQSNKRFKYDEQSNKYVPGPGSYDINSFEDWNKKSHNILFV